jgi:hypothetical protein
MKKYINGQYVELTPEEIADITVIREREEREYWQSISYDDAVDAEIRKKYSASQEFAILRQKDEKPTEYAEYFAYCESCKAYVKERKGDAV